MENDASVLMGVTMTVGFSNSQPPALFSENDALIPTGLINCTPVLLNDSKPLMRYELVTVQFMHPPPVALAHWNIHCTYVCRPSVISFKTLCAQQLMQYCVPTASWNTSVTCTLSTSMFDPRNTMPYVNPTLNAVSSVK